MAGVRVYNEETKKWEIVATNNAKGISVSNSNVKAEDVDETITELSNKYEDLKKNVAWIYENGTIGGGGGGGGGTASGEIQVIPEPENNTIYVNTSDGLTVRFMVLSYVPGNSFNLTLSRSTGSSTSIRLAANTEYSWNVGRLPSGNHSLTITGTDKDLMPIAPRSIQVVSGALELLSTFNDRLIYNIASDITIPYQVKSYLTNPIEVTATLRGIPTVFQDVPRDLIQNLELGKLEVGRHNLSIVARSEGMVSNTLNFAINVGSTDQLFLSVRDDITTNFDIGIPIRFQYTIAVIGYSAFVTTYRLIGVNGVVKEGELNSLRGTNIFTLSTDGLDAGEYSLELNAHDVDNTISTQETLTIPITLSTDSFVAWNPITNGLIARFMSRGTESTETSQWTNAVQNSPITCDLFGVNGETNGFILKDRVADSGFEINGEAYARINYKPFTLDTQVLTNGFTFNIIYKISDEGDQEARVVDCADYTLDPQAENGRRLNKGFYIDVEDAYLATDSQETSSNIGTDEWINQTFVVTQEFIEIFNNGILSAARAHRGWAEDGLEIIKPLIGNIMLGALEITNSNDTGVDVMHFADCTIKEVKIYNRALSPEEVVYNYVADDYWLHSETRMVDGRETEVFDSARQQRLRFINSIDDETKEFTLQTGPNAPMPIVRIIINSEEAERFRSWEPTVTWGDNPPLTEELGVHCTFQFSDFVHNRSFSTEAKISLQGTSSIQYTSKNFDIYFGTMRDGATPKLWSPKDSWLPENNFTLKTDMMDSSHANNVGTGRFINGIDKDDVMVPSNRFFKDSIPPKLDQSNNNAAKVKDAIDGFPVMLFIEDERPPDPNTGVVNYYRGVYMFNMGRKTPYNLGLKNYDFQIQANGEVTEYTDKPTGLYAPNNTFAMEVDTSNNNGAGAFKQFTDEWLALEFSQVYPQGALTGEGLTQLRNVVSNTSRHLGSLPILKPGEQPLSPGETGRDPYERDINGNILYTEPLSGSWVDNSRWRDSSLTDYLILAYVLGMVDNLGKNMMLKTWQKFNGISEWWATFYDMDTILGKDNTGDLRHPPSIDMDHYPTGDYDIDTNNPDNYGQGGYNLGGSRLWEIVRKQINQLQPNNPESEQLWSRYHNLRQTGVLSFENIWSYYNHIISQIGANYYNQDAKIKYLNQTVNEFGEVGYHNTRFLNGSREQYTKKWIKDRLTYMDSLWDFARTIEDSNATKGIPMRFDAGNTTILRNWMVSTYRPVWLTVRWTGEDSENIINRSKKLVYGGRNNFTNFQNSYSASEQSTNVNYGPDIMQIENLNGSRPKFLDLRNASGITDLDLRNSARLRELDLQGATSLRHLDVSGSLLLGVQDAGTGPVNATLDISQCKNLQTLDFSNTQIRNIVMPTGGTIKTLRCVNTPISSINLRNQSFLESIDLSGCTALTSFVLQDCPNIKSVTITESQLLNFSVSRCPELTTVNLSNNGQLRTLNFNGTPKVTSLNLTNCNNPNFETVTLIGCPNLVTLTMTNCRARRVHFPTVINTLRTFSCSGSGIQITQFGGAIIQGELIGNGDSFNGKPAVNFEQLGGVTSFNFSNCRDLINVINFNNNVSSHTSRFANCNNLERITGNLTLRNSASSLFSGCTKLILNPQIVDANGRIPEASLPKRTVNNLPLNLNLDNCTSFANMCTNCTSMTMYDLYYLLHRGINVTSVDSMCMNTGAISSDAIPIPATIFENLTKVTNASDWFNTSGSKIAGPIPEGLFDKMIALTNMYRAFNGCKFTTIPDTVFRYNVRLTNLESTFSSNALSGTMQASVIFRYNPLLTTVANCFSDNTDLMVNVTAQLSPFRYCPNLTQMPNVFYNCTIQGIIGENIFGGVRATEEGQEANGATATWNYPINLINISNAFRSDTNGTNLQVNWDNLTGIFTNLTGLVNCGGVFAGSNMTGTIPPALFSTNTELTNVSYFFYKSNLQGQIPATLFANNRKLANVSGLFRDCLQMSSTIPGTLFRNCESITNCDYLFDNARMLYGSIPETLFESFDADGNPRPWNVGVNGRYIFRQCWGLTGEIPGRLLSDGIGQVKLNATDISYMFYDIGNVSNDNPGTGISGPIPPTLFEGMSQVTNTSYMFHRCNFLTPYTVEVEFEDDLVYALAPGLMDGLINLTTATGMFQWTRLAINGAIFHEDVFRYNTKLANTAVMFYSAISGNISLPSNMFRYNTSLSNVSSMFSNDSGNGSGSWTGTIPSDLFRPRSVAGGIVTGNNLTNVSSVFAKNTAVKGNAIQFWNWGSQQPTTVALAYGQCTQLTDYASIPNNYK